jgi:hypothetical protein
MSLSRSSRRTEVINQYLQLFREKAGSEIGADGLDSAVHLSRWPIVLLTANVLELAFGDVYRS